MNFTSKLIDKLYLNKLRDTRCREHLKKLYVDNAFMRMLPEKYNDNIVIKRGETRKKYEGFYTHKESPDKAIIYGKKGSGKTCTMTKIAQVWACTKNCAYPVPLLLDVKNINNNMSLLKALKSQLFSECDIKISGIYKIIESRPKDFLLILDGIDESTKDNFGDVTQMVKEKWVNQMRIWITTTIRTSETLALPGDYKHFYMDQTQDHMFQHIDKLCNQDKRGLKKWIEAQTQFAVELQLEPLVFSYLCKEWQEGRPYNSPKDLIENMIESCLDTGSNENLKSQIEYLALYNLIIKKNVLIEHDESGICPKEANTLYQCREKKMDDHDKFYDIDFQSNFIQCYLGYLALINKDPKMKVMVEELMEGDFRYSLRNLIFCFKTLEILVPGEVEMAFQSESDNSIVAVYATEQLLDYITHFLPPKYQELTNEMKLLQQEKEHRQDMPEDFSMLVPPLRYSLAIDLRNRKLLGMGSLKPETLLKNYIEFVHSNGNTDYRWYIAFTKDQWKNIRFFTNIEGRLKAMDISIDLTYTIKIDEPHFKTTYIRKFVPKPHESESSEETNEISLGDENEARVGGLNESFQGEIVRPKVVSRRISEVEMPRGETSKASLLVSHEPVQTPTTSGASVEIEMKVPDIILKRIKVHGYSQIPDDVERYVRLKIFKPRKGETKNSYKDIMSTKETKVCISGVKGAGKSSLIQLMLKDWTNDDWDQVIIPLFINTAEIQTTITLHEAIAQQYDEIKDICKTVISYPKTFILLIDDVDEFIEQKISDIYKMIIEWTDIKIWLFARPDSLQALGLLNSRNCKRYDMVARKEFLEDYLLGYPEFLKEEALQLINKDMILSEKLPEDALLLNYLCKNVLKGVKFSSYRDLFESFLNDTIGEIKDKKNQRSDLELMALTNLFTNSQGLFRPKETDQISERTVSVSPELLSEPLSELYQCRQFKQTIAYEIDFQSSVIQLYLAFCLLIKSPDYGGLFYDMDLECRVNHLKVFSMFVEDIEIASSDKSTVIAVCSPGELMNVLLNMLPEGDNDVMNGRRFLQSMHTLCTDKKMKYSFAIDQENKSLVGLSSSSPGQLVEKIKEKQTVLNDGQSYFYMAFQKDILNSLQSQVEEDNPLTSLRRYVTRCKAGTANTVAYTSMIHKELPVCLEVLKEKSASECVHEIHCDDSTLHDLKMEELITQLDLSHRQLDTTDSCWLKQLFPRLTNLQHLNLHDCQLLEPNQALFGLKNISNLEYLDIQGTNLAENVSSLIEVLKANRQLTHLNISGCLLSEEKMDSILDTLLQYNTALTYLDIGYNAVSKEKLLNILKSLRRLTHLCLASIKLTADAFASLLDDLEKEETKPDVEFLDLNQMAILKDYEIKLLNAFPKLDQVYLRESLSSGKLEKLLEEFQNRQISVKGLDLSYNIIRDNEASQLANLNLNNVTHINVSNCYMSPGVSIEAISQCHSITWLDLSKNCVGDEGVENLNLVLGTLRHLNLSDTGIGHKGIANLCKGLQEKNKNLEYLNLTSNQFGHHYDTVKQLATCVPNIEYLILAFTFLNNETLKILGTNLDAKKMKSLNVSGNVIFDPNSKALLSVLKKTPMLEKLNLGSEYQPGDVTDLFTHLQNMKMKALDANFLKDEDFQILKKFLEGNQYLERLDVQKCNFSEANLAQLLKCLSDKRNFYDLHTRYTYTITDAKYQGKRAVAPIKINEHFQVYPESEHLVMVQEYPRSYKCNKDGDSIIANLREGLKNGNNDYDGVVFTSKQDYIPLSTISLENLAKDYVIDFLETADDDMNLDVYRHLRKIILYPGMPDYPSIKDGDFVNLRSLVVHDHVPQNIRFLKDHLISLKLKDVTNKGEIQKAIDSLHEFTVLNKIEVKTNTLETIRLSNNGSCLPNITSLSLTGISFDLNDLLNSMRGCPNLEILKIANCKCKDPFEAKVINEVTFLKDLCLEVNEIREKSKEKPGVFGENLKKLTSLFSFQRTAKLPINEMLDKEVNRVELTKKNVTQSEKQTSRELIKSRHKMPKLKGLLEEFDKPCDGVQQYIRSLKKSPFLSKLAITDVLYENDVKALVEVFKSNGKLTSLKLPRCVTINKNGFDTLFTKIVLLKQLTELDLSYTSVGQATDSKVAAAFTALKSLNNLNFSGIRATKAWLKATIPCAKYLKYLNLTQLEVLETSQDSKDKDYLHYICKELKYLLNLHIPQDIYDETNISEIFTPGSTLNINKTSNYNDDIINYYELVKEAVNV